MKQSQPRKKLPQKRNVPISQGKNTDKGVKSGTPSMTNWLMIFFIVFPFLFSRSTGDPVLAVRYTCLSLFVTVFVFYFFIIRRRFTFSLWPKPVKLVFLLGFGFGCWSLISVVNAENYQQVFNAAAKCFLTLVLLCIFLSVVEQEEKYIIRVLRLLGVIALVQTFIGLAQFYEFGFGDIPGNYAPYGLMANRNLFGSAQALLLPFILYLIYISKGKWKVLGILSGVGIIISVIVSQTRSAWLASLAIIVVSQTLVLIYSRVNRKRWLVMSGITISVAILSFFILAATDSKGDLKKSLVERSGSTFSQSNTGEFSTASANVTQRIKIWKKTLTIISRNPLTGIGADNWEIVVPKFGSSGTVWATGEYAPDRVHNEYLQIAAETGIPGLLLFLGTWVLISIVGFKLLRQDDSEERKLLVILMLAGMAAFAIDSMFSFPLERMEHTVYLYLMGGIILGLYLKKTSKEEKNIKLPFAIVIVMLVMGIINIVLSIASVNFEKHMVKAKMLVESGNYSDALAEGEKAKNAFINIPHNGFPVEIYTALAHKGLKNYPEALKEIDKAIRFHPYNKASYINKGNIYNEKGNFDSAIIYYKHALSLAPEMDVIILNMAVAYFQLKDYRSSLEMFNKADITQFPHLSDMKKQAELLTKEQK